MSARQTPSLVRESLTTLMTVSVILFLLGLLLSQQFDRAKVQPLYCLVPLILGVAVVLLAAYRFRNRLLATGRLEQQLASLPLDASTAAEQLHPILDQTPLGKSWNTLVKLFQDRQSDRVIDRRLEQSSSGEASGNERFARALRSLPEGIAISDRQGHVSYVNTTWANIARDADSPVGKLVTECLACNEFTNWDQVVEHCLSGTRPMKWELYNGHTTNDGVLQLERLPLEGRAEESAGFVWTLKDITQVALARQSHEQFLSSATHELRTPITNIKGYAESLIEIDAITPQQQKEFFNIIHSEANRLGRLLNQLLDIQQLEAGSMTVTRSAFDVLRMVQEVQEHINPLVKDKQLKFTCRIPPDLKTINADKEKIISCLVNLLGNAIKYTPAGGEVRLSAEQLEDTVNIAVEDTGIGIAESELSKIFDRFYRCDDARVAELEGNGLGLAFAMEVARLHNGDLKVESQLNKGSRFTLQLPVTNQG